MRPWTAPLQWLRERQPSWLTPVLVRGRASAVRATPAGRDRSRAAMRLLVPERTPGQIEALARRHVLFSCRRSEVRHHPGTLVRQEVLGTEHLVAARAEGRGVLLAFLHHGHYAGSFASVAAAGHPVTTVASSPTFAADPPPWMVHHRAMLLAHPDARIVDVAIGFHGIADLLRTGATVVLCADGPGPASVDFLGRRWRGMTSIAGLALLTGAAVVPMTSRRVGRYDARVELGAPLRAADHADPEALTRRVLAALEPAVRAWPEAYDVPLQLWLPAP